MSYSFINMPYDEAGRYFVESQIDATCSMLAAVPRSISGKPSPCTQPLFNSNQSKPKKPHKKSGENCGFYDKIESTFLSFK